MPLSNLANSFRFGIFELLMFLTYCPSFNRYADAGFPSAYPIVTELMRSGESDGFGTLIDGAGHRAASRKTVFLWVILSNTTSSLLRPRPHLVPLSTGTILRQTDHSESTVPKGRLFEDSWNYGFTIPSSKFTP